MESRFVQLADEELMAVVQAGRWDAFAELVRRHELALLRVAESRLGNRQAAEDVLQETLLCVFKSRGTFIPTASFRTWLWTILLNQCRRRAKQDARRPRVLAWTDVSGADGQRPQETIVVESRDDTPSTALLLRERSEHLADLLGRLPDSEADAVRLRFFAGLKYQEIADAMGCSLLTAKNRVRRALQRTASWIRERRLLAEGDGHEL